MTHWGRRINRRAYDVISSVIIIFGMLLLIGGLCIMVIGLLRQ